MEQAVSAGILGGAAVSMAIVHTVVGVDHTLPIIALSSARAWSMRKTLLITAALGAGHVLSSALLGAIALGFGVALERLEWIESASGAVSAWLLIGFGVALSLRALLRREKLHRHGSHVHTHGDMGPHQHEHELAVITPLFAIFLLGPCEPLVPLMVAPGAAGAWGPLTSLLLVFALATIGTMVGLVAAGRLGASLLPPSFLVRHGELLAGLTLVASGVAIETLGI